MNLQNIIELKLENVPWGLIFDTQIAFVLFSKIIIKKIKSKHKI